MSKILYVSTISSTVNAFLIPHIKMLINEGHKVDVAFNIVAEVNPELTNMGCKIYNIKFQRSPLDEDNLSAYKEIKKLVLKEGYDVIHTHTPIASFLTRMACRNIDNIKIIYTAHGFHFYKGAPLKSWLIYYTVERFSAKYTDSIITMNSEDYLAAKKMKLRRKESAYKISGVGVSLVKFFPSSEEEKVKLRKNYDVNDDDFILFYAAELNYNKRQDLLINVVSLLKDEIPNIKLLLAGEGNKKKDYEDLVKELKIEDYVKFMGNRKDVDSILKISDVAVASSRREGLPVIIMEAMATGLPVVATDCRGQRDLVTDGVNGYIVDGENKALFSERIKSLYDSKELRYEFGKNNIEKVKQYSVGNVIEELRAIYLKLLKD